MGGVRPGNMNQSTEQHDDYDNDSNANKGRHRQTKDGGKSLKLNPYSGTFSSDNKDAKTLASCCMK
jgi:hypothetical protein